MAESKRIVSQCPAGPASDYDGRLDAGRFTGLAGESRHVLRPAASQAVARGFQCPGECPLKVRVWSGADSCEL